MTSSTDARAVIIQRAADRATRTAVPALVTELNAQLGITLVAYVAGAADRKAPYRWASGRVTPRDHVVVRLRFLYRIWLMVSGSDGPDVARNWMVGANPRLSEEAPVVLLRFAVNDGQVLAAAKAFVEDQGGA